MSIQSEITRISTNVSDALDAIEDKGVTIPSGANSDDLADLIAQITGGGGVGGITQDQDGYLVLSPDAPSPAPGGGLEYETGTWSPSEDVNTFTFLFANTHSQAPFFYMVTDIGGYYDTASSYHCMAYWCPYQFSGEPIHASTTSDNYALGLARYRSTSATSLSNVTQVAPSLNAVAFYATNTSIKPVHETYYWRAGRTYKWIAVWAPTT